jgi:hypothetical protein
MLRGELMAAGRRRRVQSEVASGEHRTSRRVDGQSSAAEYTPPSKQGGHSCRGPAGARADGQVTITFGRPIRTKKGIATPRRELAHKIGCARNGGVRLNSLSVRRPSMSAPEGSHLARDERRLAERVGFGARWQLPQVFQLQYLVEIRGFAQTSRTSQIT